MGKSVYDKIREAQLAGTFEGTMKAQGKNVRYFSDEYFDSHSPAEIAREMNSEEYSYYQSKVHARMETVAKEEQAAKVAEYNNFQATLELDREKAVEVVMRKYQKLPAPIRPTIEKTEQDIKRLIGNPYINDFSYREKLKNYVGEVEGGNIPSDVSPEGK